MKFEEWFDVWDQTKDPEIRRLCGIAFAVGHDHATAPLEAENGRLGTELVVAMSTQLRLEAEIKRLRAGMKSMANSLRQAGHEMSADNVESLLNPPTGEREAGPTIICLCGSTRFIELFAIKTWELELEGNIVLGCTLLPAWYTEGTRDHFAEKLGVKDQRDTHHLQKIDLADKVLVLNKDGYIGESTKREIAYAKSTGKPVEYLEPLTGEREG
jgi:hypothetical protein